MEKSSPDVASLSVNRDSPSVLQMQRVEIFVVFLFSTKQLKCNNLSKSFFIKKNRSWTQKQSVMVWSGQANNFHLIVPLFL